MKKFFVMLLVSLLVLNTNVFAENIDSESNVIVTLNGKKSGKLNLLYAKNINKRVMIKAVNVGYCLGANFNYDASNKEISFTRIGKNINMYMDSDILILNNKQLIMDCNPMIIEGFIYVPLKYLAEALDYKIEWNNELKAVNINTLGIKLGDCCAHIPLELINSKYINNISNNDIDYTVEYKNLLNNMFTNGWNVSEENKYFVEYFGWEENMGKTPYIYTEWNIVFKDKAYNNTTIVINNNDKMGYFVQNYILDKSKEYYMENYINKYFNDSNITYKIAFYFAYKYELNNELYEKYIDDLENINLCEFEVSEIYDILPVYVSINLLYNTSLLENNNEKQLKIDEIRNTALNMINEINKDTNNKANIEFFISDSGDYINGEKIYRDYILNGSKYNDNPKAVIDMGFLISNIYKTR